MEKKTKTHRQTKSEASELRTCVEQFSQQLQRLVTLTNGLVSFGSYHDAIGKRLQELETQNANLSQQVKIQQAEIDRHHAAELKSAEIAERLQALTKDCVRADLKIEVLTEKYQTLLVDRNRLQKELEQKNT